MLLGKRELRPNLFSIIHCRFRIVYDKHFYIFASTKVKTDKRFFVTCKTSAYRG